MDTQSVIPILKDDRYKGIIFDLDETLFYLKIDWDALKATLENTMLTSFDIAVKFTPYIPALSYVREKNIDAYKHAIKIIEEAEVKGLKDGKPNRILLDYVANETNKKFGIYSMNTTKTVRGFLEEYKLQDKFREISTQQTCIEPKPSGKDLLHIMSKWRYNSTEVLFIGNSGYDKKSGEMAQIRTEIIQM